MSDRTLFIDDFARADNTDIGANWDSGYTSLDNLQILSNGIQAVNEFTQAYETVNSVAFPADQWAYVTLLTFTATGSAQQAQIILRSTAPTAHTCYEFVAAQDTGTYTSRIVYRLNGVNTASTSENATTWAAGDVLGAAVIGGALTLYRNGSPLLTMNDSNLTSGRVGMSIVPSTPVSNIVLDDFTAGDFASDGLGGYLRTRLFFGAGV